MSDASDNPALDSIFSISLERSQRSRSQAIEDEVVNYFEQYRLPLLRYLSCLGLSYQDGEELCQEVFLSLFEHLRQNKSAHNLRGWIFRVAHNLGLKRRTDQQHQLNYWREADERECERRDPTPSAEERLFQRERQNRLLSVVNALPGQQKWCLYLRAEGLRYREISDVLGISLGHVSQSLSKAIERLMNADLR